MIIKKKRIRNLDSNIGFIEKGTTVAVGIKGLERYKELLEKIGFRKKVNAGDSVLPSISFGSVSSFNAEGRYKKHKDQPMETAYRTVEWHWQEWNGPYDRIEKSKLVDVPYKRYPRTFISPPSVEITAIQIPKDDLILVSPFIEYTEKNKHHLIHTVNLFLEIFGECQLFKEDLSEIINVPVRRLNWRILPLGPMPWEQLEKEIKPLVKAAPKGNQPAIWHRLTLMREHNPDFLAIGEAGFKGYIIFGFKKKNVFMCESIYYGNATYIFDEKWKELTKKTKAEILNKDLQKDRVIHKSSWTKKIKRWLS